MKASCHQVYTVYVARPSLHAEPQLNTVGPFQRAYTERTCSSDAIHAQHGPRRLDGIPVLQNFVTFAKYQSFGQETEIRISGCIFSADKSLRQRPSTRTGKFIHTSGRSPDHLKLALTPTPAGD